MRRRLGRLGGSALLTTLDIIGSVAIATGAVAALQSTAPPGGLGIVYLLAVLTVAIRRGERPALLTSVLSVLTLNYLFIPPRHQLSIAHSQDVVELLVLLIAAVVVGRLASLARQRAGEADTRARVAAAHEREAALLADTAAAILAGETLTGQLESVGQRIASATAATRARIVLDPQGDPEPGEQGFQLPSRYHKVWLYLQGEPDVELVAQLASPLGDLVDVTVERARLAEQAAETEASRRTEIARTAILHAISHDLRSPLTAITTAAAGLRTPEVTEAERHELLGAVEAETSRLARMVDDLLDLSKIEAGAVAPQADWCDLHDVVASAAARLRGAHPIEFELPPDLPLVRADAAQLERVFWNLLENAIKFSPPGSPVRITGGASPAWVTVRVIDQGRGIPREHRRRVFEPFFRGRPGPTSGSGLGLAICRGFVEANGGRIVLQSGTGGGTSFAVSFPVVEQPPHTRDPASLAAGADAA